MDYLSVIGTSYLHPIVDLVARLQRTPPTPPNEVQTGPIENGLACAIILASVAMLESISIRVHRLKGDSGIPKDVPEYLANIVAQPNRAELDEIMVVRNSVAHGHVWEAGITWDAAGNLHWVSAPALSKGQTTSRYTNAVDVPSGKTRSLGLNVIPTKVWRDDAYKVLQIVIRTLHELQVVDLTFVNIDAQYVVFDGELFLVSDLMSEIGVPI